ncbi:Rv2578c family radical SAM protein [Nakamurella alba]|uniref:Rv2578c family radical SAM protein n=1 Tax=Nakamurella alba TaxID=2665158 RepID=UPI002AC368D8|nr:Rv2578c family radical SAM protein [Nakamurella alba]
MRWERQSLLGEDPSALPGLGRLGGLVRSVRTPEFAGVTFHEVVARSVLNRIRGPMPFSWTVNPYRGCTHACVYCFARNTHTYLEFDAGHDFDTEIVVKTNIAQVLGKQLAAPSWRREQVAMGTNTDPYQRAEGRYALMPGIIETLVAHRTPFSILTKGTVLSRDLPLLAEAATRVPVGIGVSLALVDKELQQLLEPGTPSPTARLQLVRRITDAGLPCGVLVAPLLPYLTDSEQQITEVMADLKEAGATGVTGFALHLRPGAREWFLRWLAEQHPELVPAYEGLYRRGANADAGYRAELAERVRRARRRVGITRSGDDALRGVPGAEGESFPEGAMPGTTPSGSPDHRAPAEQQALF